MIFLLPELLFYAILMFTIISRMDPQKLTVKGEQSNHSSTAPRSRLLSPNQLIFLVFPPIIPILWICISRVTTCLIRYPFLLPMDVPIMLYLPFLLLSSSKSLRVTPFGTTIKTWNSVCFSCSNSSEACPQINQIINLGMKSYIPHNLKKIEPLKQKT